MFNIKRNIDNIEIYLWNIKILKFSKNSYIKVLLKKLYSIFLKINVVCETIFSPIKRFKKIYSYVNYVTNSNSDRSLFFLIK